jgi:hypothetical protein
MKKKGKSKEQEDNEVTERALLDCMDPEMLYCFSSKLCTSDPKLRNELSSKALS